MALITVQKASLSGVTAALVAASAGGDKFVNDGDTLLHVKNGSGAGITVTVAAVSRCSHGSFHDSVSTVAAGATTVIGPFPQNRFNDVSGQVSVTYSAVTTVTVAATTTEL